VTGLVIPGLVVPKARPRFDPRSKRAYHEARYKDWLAMAGQMIAYTTRAGYTDDDLLLRCAFGAEGVEVEWLPCSPVKRPKGIQGDVDNLIGSVMDAIQASGRISDDKQFVRIEGWIVP